MKPVPVALLKNLAAYNTRSNQSWDETKVFTRKQYGDIYSYRGASKNAFAVTLDCERVIIKMPILSNESDFYGVKREYEMYERAPEIVKPLLAPVFEYGTVMFRERTIPYYVSAYCSDSGLFHTHVAPNWIDKWHNLERHIYTDNLIRGGWYPSFSTVASAMFVRDHGEDAFIALLQFLADEDSGDLHNGNVAFYNDRIVCIDYSGYRGGCTS